MAEDIATVTRNRGGHGKIVARSKMPSAGVRDLSRAGTKAKSAVAYRDSLIRLWHDEGYSLREIAEAVGTLTHSAIARIVKK